MISVVIPIYNVAQYLSQCIDSVLSQSYPELEIILVNDGSTDDCPRICDEYKEKDARVRVIHQKNGGLSDARNSGMKIAEGEWIYFADSDDWLERNALLKLHQFALINHCDVVQGGLYYVYSDHLLFRKASKKEQMKTLLTRYEAMRELIINDRVKNFAWGKLYKATLIKDLFFPVGKYFEDSFWQHLVIDRVTQYGIIDEPLYFYRQRGDSISGTSSNRLNDLLEGNKVRLKFIKEKYPDLLPLMIDKYNVLSRQLFPSKTAWGKCEKICRRIVSMFNHKKYEKIHL
ncbi:MAG: glycosyltransferase family 2 protein [Bacteroidaceae bacterium]|nr:glycosyltransferase family 2 protein [Bacteroidaceae bacterium]